MPESRSKPKISARRAEVFDRGYQSEVATLQSLRLIAAPDPKDDLSDDELAARFHDPAQSPDLIRHLIDFIKTL